MTDPPRVPGPKTDRSDDALEHGINPYATAEPVEREAPARARVELPAVYWIAIVAALAIFVLACFVWDGLPLPAVLALLAAAVRVPLLQLRLTRTRPLKELPSPLLLLLTSWSFMLVSIFAAAIAFVAICLPAGIITWNMAGSGGDGSVGIILVLSGGVGLAAFVALFFYSLRLPV